MRIRATGKVKGHCQTFGTFYGPECYFSRSALAHWSGSKDSSSALNLYIYGWLPPPLRLCKWWAIRSF